MSPEAEKPTTWLIAGLGNPGAQYALTRHNIGFRVVDRFAVEHRMPWKRSLRFCGEWSRTDWNGVDLMLLKPHTLMNLSGKSVHSLMAYHGLPASALVCVCDDITIPFADAKLSFGSGDAGHNGIKDIASSIRGSFARLRIGVGGKRHPDQKLADHVLSRFSDEENQLIEDRMSHYLECIGKTIQKGPIHAMNWINQKHS
ncbi:MAG: aminoacyl-tRNA hydrolase [Opitutales bacterium]|nr:aminoacyl-tRNA hydrolase [Opitutales bacterium]